MSPDVHLTEAQVQLLKESYRVGFVSSLSRQTARSVTAQALIDKGLADYAMASDYPGGELKPVSVWGGPLTSLGRELAERLLAAKSRPLKGMT